MPTRGRIPIPGPAARPSAARARLLSLRVRGAAVKAASERDSGVRRAEALRLARQAVLTAAAWLACPRSPVPGLWGCTRSASRASVLLWGLGWRRRGGWGPVYRRSAGCLLALEPPSCSGVHGCRPPSAAPAVSGAVGVLGWRVPGPPASWEPRAPRPSTPSIPEHAPPSADPWRASSPHPGLGVGSHLTGPRRRADPRP